MTERGERKERNFEWHAMGTLTVLARVHGAWAGGF